MIKFFLAIVAAIAGIFILSSTAITLFLDFLSPFVAPLDFFSRIAVGIVLLGIAWMAISS